MAKGETHVLPSSYIAESRFTDDAFCHMRNNVCDMAQFLREGLVGRLFMRADGRHIEGGFPHKPIDFGRKDPHIRKDHELDTRFFESVGTYQANHEDATYRLNSLNVFAIGYILRNAAMFCVRYQYRLKLLIDSVISTMLPKFKITRRPDEPVLDPDAKYYELEIAQDPTTPKEYEFYVTIESGAMTNEDDVYYRFDSKTNCFGKCAILDPNNTYYTKNDDDTFSIIDTHVVGELQGKDIYQMFPDGEIKNIGNAWEETDDQESWLVVIPSKTRNNTYSDPSQCMLFRQIKASDTQELISKLYVDCTEEDVELLKDYVNILIKHYRTVLTATGRKKFKYREIVSTIPFTIEDLAVRINALIESCDFRDSLDRPIILPIDMNEYTIRNLKLRVNKLIDAINEEAFFLKLIDITSDVYQKYNLDNILGDFFQDIRMNELAWEDLVASSLRSHDHQLNPTFVHEFDGYCYNDLGFVYNPYESASVQHVFDRIDFTEYGDGEGIGMEGFTLSRGATSYIVPQVYMEDNVTLRRLSDILNLALIADVWRACDYIGSMYVLDCTSRMLKRTAPDGTIWKDGLAHPRVEVTQEQQTALDELLAKIDQLDGMLDLLKGSAPVAALTVSDLGLRVSDYSVIYTCE